MIRIRIVLVLAALALSGCLCSPDGTWWGDGLADPDAMADGVDGIDGEGEGDAGEGEGDVGEGEGEGDEGEGEGDVGEGEGEGEGDVGEGEGEGDGTVFVEIDYSSAFTSSSPGWEFSQSAFGPQDWAMSGDSSPQAWDRFNNMDVVDDPIGRSLELDGELQLMLGLLTLQSYDRVVVRIEGRARETSSSVTFDVFNPLNGCGVSGITMSNDWTVHSVDVDLAQCLIPGEGVQAVRVDPTNGTLALVRMRVILEGAVY